ncbi:hypothetical protein [Kineococcus rhizosphaerae]|uniref:Uncharacterized protein n=1 Tax=Kineococcus rhizosphaerae TaxID=559628 RepID=A0A2T0R7W7_9ACTN|nr:hypothetical protein [Kineococcus rhizosphaerae]PRY17255.1 hypothetical protein CLV37_102214 [Kineococcus rhizosphaerae]
MTDPDEVDPWSLSLVARVERDPAPTHTDTLVAAARAVVLLLSDPRVTEPDGELRAAVQAWRDRRIRKICRRARGAKWDRTAGLPHAEASSGDAVVRVFAPHPRDDVPDLLRPLQVGGLDLSDPEDLAVPGPDGVLTIRLTPGVTMSTGKAAAQVGHAAQLALERLPQAGRWQESGSGVRVVVGAPVLPEHERVDVRDGGFTEVPPGTVTASAGFEGTV